MRTLATRCHEKPDNNCLGCTAMAIIYTERAIKEANKKGDFRSEIAMSQEIQGLYFVFDGLCGSCGGSIEECPDYDCQENP